MNDDTIQKLKDAVSKSTNIGIAVGKSPSVDEMAAALSLYLLLKSVNKQVSIASPSDPIVEISSLVGINKVQRSLGGESNDLIVSFPYREGEIEKVSYTLEEGYLNIVVKASEQGLSFDEKDVKYVRGSGAIDLLFVIGTAKISDLGDVIDSQKLRDIQVINIDNKENNERFGDIVLVSSKFSSVSEQVADLTLTLGFRIDQDVAQNLLIGVTVATENFQAPNTSSLAFELAGLLMKRGAKRLRMDQPEKDPFISSLSQDEDEAEDLPSVPVGQRPQLDEVRSDAPRPRQSDQRHQGVQGGQQRDQRQPRDSRPTDNNGQDNRGIAQQRPQGDLRRPSSAPQGPASDEQRRGYANQQPKQNLSQPNQDQDQVVNPLADQDEEPPMDWLTPKVYKGSSDVE